MFNNTDKKIETLGFYIVEENDYICIYTRNLLFGTQFVTLSKHNDGDIQISSDVFIKGVNGYRAFPLKVDEVKLFLKKIRKLGWYKKY